MQLNARPAAPPFTAVLDFWFAPAESRERGTNRAVWFRKDPAFDARVRDLFLPLVEEGAAGRLDAWSATPYAALALVVVLDQFPRNLFRGEPRAFSADARALATARQIVARGFDRVLRPLERTFVYLPFEHAEDLAAQRRSLQLFESLRRFDECRSAIDYARRHYEIVVRFGRFPHRNAALGRGSTAEEVAFLAQPGSGF